ncbi:MAG TPA: selenoneine biosynthesis selenosugar synthase SenB [Terriglobia bacterium]|nr:selenoneine biosynthesis selenosugar synthase SenB [Terriglobia bacterium]
MRIAVVTPAPPRTHYGNRVTAIRWARILRRLGHRVAITQDYNSEPCDLLIALHAHRSYPAVRRFRQMYPHRPLVLALTGTDLYRDLPRSRAARQSCEMASRIVVLQPKAKERLPRRLHPKVRVIFQSVAIAAARPKSARTTPQQSTFDVCVIGHLRPVKDPFRAALAARLVPPSSRLRVLHLGAAMTAPMASRARAEMAANCRYRWLDEQTPTRVRQILSRSRLCVLSSKLEGGANVLSEAIVAGTPVLCSRIPGSTGILGEDYAGYFEVGDTAALAKLLLRAETEDEFLKALCKHCARLRPLFRPKCEELAWKRLLAEL